MQQAYYNMGGVRRLSTVIKHNYHTVWVKIILGANEFVIIKRHKRKHRVWVMP